MASDFDFLLDQKVSVLECQKNRKMLKNYISKFNDSKEMKIKTIFPIRDYFVLDGHLLFQMRLGRDFYTERKRKRIFN